MIKSAAASAPVSAAGTQRRPFGDHPVLEAISEFVGIAIAHRPVLAATAAIVDAVQFCLERSLRFALLTPPSTRLTMPLRMLLVGTGSHWVIDTDDGCFDGVNGERLCWDGQQFAVVDPSPHPRFLLRPPTDCLQAMVSMTVQHPAANSTRLGRAVEVMAASLTGAQPTGWGVAEPVAQDWDRDGLTAFAAGRMPAVSRIVVAGAPDRPMIATMTVTRTDLGVDEDVTMLARVAGRPAAEQATSTMRNALARAAAKDTVAFALGYLRSGAADLCVSAQLSPPAAPVCLLLGPRAVRSLGRNVLASAPLPEPNTLGRPAYPTLVYELDPRRSWTQLADLLHHLGPERIADVLPELSTSLAGRSAASTARTELAWPAT